MEKLKAVEHKFKAFVFSLSRRFLKRAERNFHPLDGKKLSKVLFLRPEKIGDLVVSLPVIDGLKRAHPGIGVSILASPRNIELIEADSRFEEIFLYRKSIFKDLAQLREIRKRKFDCVVDMMCDDSVTALFLAQWCAPGKPRIGVGKKKFREYYDFNYDHRAENSGHIIDNSLRLLDAFGIDSSAVSGYAPPYIAPSAFATAERFLASIPKVAGKPLLIGYNISTGHPSRIWAAEKSEELLRRVLKRFEGAQVIIISMNPDRPRGEALVSKFDSNIRQVPPSLSLMEASALVSKLDLLITPDTSWVHIARSLHVPVVGFYCKAQKNFVLWSPYGQKDGAVVSGHDGNIFDITVDQAFDVVLKVMAVRKQAV
jgi:ADP-heptose:LPS heptosyltransferase